VLRWRIMTMRKNDRKMKNVKTKRCAIVVDVPPEMLDAVRRAAATDDRTVASWVRRAIARELESHGPSGEQK
jgi:hypothetical protein